jgi:hypothetical protein
MKALVLYDSQYGDTEHIAQAIANALGEFGEVRAVRLDPAQPVEVQGLACSSWGPRRRDGDRLRPSRLSSKEPHPKNLAALGALASIPGSGCFAL